MSPASHPAPRRLAAAPPPALPAGRCPARNLSAALAPPPTVNLAPLARTFPAPARNAAGVPSLAVGPPGQPPTIPAIVPVVICASLILRFTNKAQLQAAIRDLWQGLEPELPTLLDALEVPRQAKLRRKLQAAGRERPGLAVAVLLALVVRAHSRDLGPVLIQASAPYLPEVLMGVPGMNPRPKLSLRNNSRLRNSLAAHAGLSPSEDHFPGIWDRSWDLVKGALFLALTDPVAWLDGCTDGEFGAAHRRALARELASGYEAKIESVTDAALERLAAQGGPAVGESTRSEVLIDAERALALLTPREQAICQLMADSGCTRADAARKLGITPGAARQSHFRAAARLDRAQLSP